MVKFYLFHSFRLFSVTSCFLLFRKEKRSIAQSADLDQFIYFFIWLLFSIEHIASGQRSWPCVDLMIAYVNDVNRTCLENYS